MIWPPARRTASETAVCQAKGRGPTANHGVRTGNIQRSEVDRRRSGAQCRSAQVGSLLSVAVGRRYAPTFSCCKGELEGELEGKPAA